MSRSTSGKYDLRFPRQDAQGVYAEGGGGSEKRLAIISFSSEVASGVAARDAKRLVH